MKESIGKDFIGHIGHIDNLNIDIYHSTYQKMPALGASQIKIALKSIHAFNEIVIKGRREEKKQSYLDFGRYAHSYLLENNQEDFVIGPNVSKLTKEWKEFVDNNKNKIILTLQEHNKLNEMKEEIDLNEVASNLILSSHIERSYFYVNKDNLWLKGRPDGVDKNNNFIFDYKTSSSIKDNDFRNTIEKYGYHVSAAHYIECHKALFDKEIKDYYFIVQEKTIPYEVKVFKADESMIAEGRRLLNIALKKINSLKENCFKIEKSFEEIKVLNLPNWNSWSCEIFNEISEKEEFFN